MSTEQHTVRPVAIVLASCGNQEQYPVVDPYWDAETTGDWSSASRGDGRTYGGVVEWIRPRAGEDQAALLARAQTRAGEL